MNDSDAERSPKLERLFAATDRELADEAFVTSVMRRTSFFSSRNVSIAAGVCLAAAPLAWLLAAPLSDVMLWGTQLLAQPIARTSNDVASTVLPMNTVGGALALGLLALRAIARRLFAESN